MTLGWSCSNHKYVECCKDFSHNAYVSSSTIEGPSSPTPLYYIQISCSLTIPMEQWTKFKLMVNFEDPSLKLKDLSVQVRLKEFSHWLT